MPHDTKRHFDEDDVIRSDSGVGTEFADIVSRRLSRREVLAGAFAGWLTLGPFSTLASAGASPIAASSSPTGLDFSPITPKAGSEIILAPNYRHQVVVKWGDPIKKGIAAFDPNQQSTAHQANAFGYNCDFVGFMPLPYGSKSSSRGLLGVNHEYPNPELMFPIANEKAVSKEQVEICLEAVGFGVVEIKKSNGAWSTVVDSPFNARVTGTTPLRISGPAEGSRRMKTSHHPDGRGCIGTMNNCAAGKTPWGTVLSGEENFQAAFGNASTLKDAKEARSAKRYGLGQGESEYVWERFVDRFDCAKEPNEANTFGWVVEIDPYDPEWQPVKRTSLGRFRHEAATTHITKAGKVVMYSGDDARFEYVYKFVCSKSYNRTDRKANRDILDEGILYVAKFNDDGSGEWLPLIHGQGPLTSANGFDDQADVVIDARIAADLLGATKMDRPEDIEVNPVSEKVYVVCTNNVDRGKAGKDGPDKANPRSENAHGHIIEMVEDGNDHAATKFKWELFMVCGDPKDESTFFAGFPKDKLTPISCPDNICFDPKGNLWIATDGMERAIKLPDGFFAVPTEGPERGQVRQFMSSVVGSEVCGPEFTPDGKTAFLAIQHPGEGSSFANPSTSWPEKSGPPRPSIIAIEAVNGDVIGSKGG